MYSFSIADIPFEIPTWIVVLSGASCSVGFFMGLFGSFGYSDLSTGGRLLTSIAAAMLCAILPVVGIVLFAVGYGTFIDMWRDHCSARRRRWEKAAERAIEEGLAIGQYNCGECGGLVSAEDRRRNECPHCGVHWDIDAWRNAPPWGDPQITATGVWFCLDLAFFFGLYGLAAYFIILLAFTLNVIRDSQRPWRVSPLWIASILVLVLYYLTLYPRLGPVGIVRFFH